MARLPRQSTIIASNLSYKPIFSIVPLGSVVGVGWFMKILMGQQKSWGDRVSSADIAKVIAGSLAMAIGAQVTIPLTPVPVTLQTLALLLVAWFLGPQRGAAAITIYLIEGAFGLPVFSHFSSGWICLLGLRGGYLWSFIPAAFLAGWLYSSVRSKGMTAIFCAGCTSLMLVLALGWFQLMFFIGPKMAWSTGVVPFYGVEIAKALVAALVAARCVLWQRRKEV